MATRPQGYPRLESPLDMRAFHCTKCGICCMLVGRLGIPALDPEHKVRARADGACVHLLPNLECAIYETRPRICNVKASAPKWLPLRVTYWLTERICWLAQRFYP